MCDDDNNNNNRSNDNGGSHNDETITKPIVIFSSSLAKLLPSDNIRLPPTYIGVRRVRPSNRIVKYALSAAVASSGGDSANIHTNKRRRLIVNEGDDNDEMDIDDPNAKDKSNAEDNATAITNAGCSSNSNQVVFKVTDENGVERRMTTQEKKELKMKLREEKKLAKKRERERRQQQLQLEQQKQPKEDTEKKPAESESTVKDNPLAQVEGDDGNNSRYHKLQVNAEALEEELAELRGLRTGGATPVMLPGSMARQAIRLGLLQQHNSGEEKEQTKNDIYKKSSSFSSSIGIVKVDDELAKEWAKLIKNKMKRAEEARSKEDMRPMAYEIVPEVWSRLRPSSLSTSPSSSPTTTKECTTMSDATTLKEENGSYKEKATNSPPPAAAATTKQSSDEWLFVETRPTLHPIDSHHTIVYDCLHRHTNLHIACGAKFGCDFLLYDGKREERHAFAGLRVISHYQESDSSSNNNINSNENNVRGGKEKADESGNNNKSDTSLIIPSPYDLAGYVRGLNTAGKLALLASVVTKKDVYSGQISTKVAFVDLALEKILSAPTHRKKMRGGGGSSSRKNNNRQKRKQIGQNLSKKRGS